jgi:RNA polymerase sigma-70 factor (ECF subfamily)
LSPRSGHETRETELLERVASGDPRAFAELYERFGAILFGIVLRILRSRAEAEDALQEIFLEIWQRAASYDSSRGRVLPWLTLLARSRAVDRLRARSVRDRVAAEIAAEPEPSALDTANDVVLNEDCLIARRALEQVSADQRTALTLAYFEGLTQSEIAARLGKPLGTVKTHTRLGLLRLRELLSESGRKP